MSTAVCCRRARPTLQPEFGVTVASGGTLDLNGFNQTLLNLTNAGFVNMGTGTPALRARLLHDRPSATRGMATDRDQHVSWR